MFLERGNQKSHLKKIKNFQKKFLTNKTRCAIIRVFQRKERKKIIDKDSHENQKGIDTMSTTTTTTKKTTAVSALTRAIEKLDAIGFDAEVVDKLESIKTSYEKKAEAAKGKASTKGAENAAIGEKILAEMEQGKSYTLSDIAKFDCLNGMELTTAKVRALIDAPLDDGRIKKGSVKGRVCYWLAW